MPSRKEPRERNDHYRDDAPRDHVPRSTRESPNRYPVSFAQTKLVVISGILL
jgi:hypothetical protein